MELFNSSVNSLGSRTEHTGKFTALANTLEGRTVIQRKADRTEKRASKNLVKFTKGKCRALHLAWHNLTQQHRLGSKWLLNNLKFRDLMVLVDKLNVSYQCPCSEAAKYIPGCISRIMAAKQQEVITLPIQNPRDHVWSLVASLEPSEFETDTEILQRVQQRPSGEAGGGDA